MFPPVAIAHLERIADRRLDVHWQDGRVDRFPAIWLRDNLPLGRYKEAGQRLFDVCDLPEQVSLVSAHLPSHAAVEVVFHPDNLTCRFDVDGCVKMRPTQSPPKISPSSTGGCSPWGDATENRRQLLEPIHRSDVCNREKALIAWL